MSLGGDIMKYGSIHFFPILSDSQFPHLLSEVF